MGTTALRFRQVGPEGETFDGKRWGMAVSDLGTHGSGAGTSRRRTRRWTTKSLLAIVLSVAAVAVSAGAAGAYYGFRVRGGGQSDALLRCNGGMTHLSHVFDENASVFEGDPPPSIQVVFTVEEDGFLLEEVTTGTHTSTHLDAPIHFIAGGRSVDQLEAEELVWPAYIIDVRQRMTDEGPDFQLSVADIRRYERRNGRVPTGALVVIRTGFDEKFGTPAYSDPAPGFSGEAVQWLFDRRHIGGLGSDTFGPDATSDEDFAATFTALLNDGVVIPGMNNVGSLHRNGDLIIAPTVRLAGGSGYQTAPLACHRSG